MAVPSFSVPGVFAEALSRAGLIYSTVLRMLFV
jgi:hypothetical protein